MFRVLLCGFMAIANIDAFKGSGTAKNDGWIIFTAISVMITTTLLCLLCIFVMMYIYVNVIKKSRKRKKRKNEPKGPKLRLPYYVYPKKATVGQTPLVRDPRVPFVSCTVELSERKSRSPSHSDRNETDHKTMIYFTDNTFEETLKKGTLQAENVDKANFTTPTARRDSKL